MKRKLILSAVLLMAVSALAVFTASAAGVLEVNWWTVDGGGASSSTGDSYSLAGTIGQPDAGPAMTGDLNGETLSLTGGFLAGIWAGGTTSISISGNAGVAGATLSYDDGGPQSAIADISGDYGFTVPAHWSGVVTPSKDGCDFTPINREYIDVLADLAGEDYAASCVGTNDAPVITEGASVNASTTETGFPYPLDLTLHATDADLDTLTWSVGSPPAHGSISLSGTGLSKAILYFPEAGYNGTDSLVVVVDDGFGGSDSILINLTVRHVTPHPP